MVADPARRRILRPMNSTAWIAGQPVPPDILGRLREAPDGAGAPAQWANCLSEDGYVLLRGALPVAQVQLARRDVLDRMAAVGEIAEPPDAAVATGTSRRAALHPELGVFWREVCEAPALRSLSHGSALASVARAVLGGPAEPFDFLWLRTMVQGRASPLHLDHVYMNRGTQNLVTAWIPLGDVPLAAGPLVVVEGSHRFADVAARYRGIDVDRDSLPGSFPEDAVAFARGRGARLLTADFRAGDVLLFDMFTLHGSCDNRTGGNRVRLSCDVRWQRAGEPRDDRWFGNPPPGHGGTGYGGLNGARPLGGAYIAR